MRHFIAVVLFGFSAVANAQCPPSATAEPAYPIWRAPEQPVVRAGCAILGKAIIGSTPPSALQEQSGQESDHHDPPGGPPTECDDSIDGATVLINGSSPIETHSNYANGISLYTHADAEFRAPYIDFYKSRGTEASPSPVLSTGYELDSLGGINFGGWDGVKYFQAGAAIYTQTDENWTPTAHGAHLSIYSTDVGRSTENQIAQFGGLDPVSLNTQLPGVSTNIIFYRPLTWNGNQAGDPGIFPSSNPARLSLRTGDDSGDANLSAGSASFSGTVSAAGGSANHVVCWKAGGALGYCSSRPDSTGSCNCQ